MEMNCSNQHCVLSPEQSIAPVVCFYPLFDFLEHLELPDKVTFLEEVLKKEQFFFSSFYYIFYLTHESR